MGGSAARRTLTEIGDDGTVTDRMTGPHYGRRRFLAGGAVAGLGAVIGVGVNDIVAARDGVQRATPRTTRTTSQSSVAPLVSGSFHSTRRGLEVGWTVSRPPGWRAGDDVPLCLVLHGFAADHSYAFDELRLQDVQAELAQGDPARPLVLAAVDGGDGYWHPRADGDDPQGMLVDEFLPIVRGTGAVTNRVVAFGWSMGGYGALLLAETYPKQVQRVGAESPAIWPSYAASRAANPSAFDSAVDWRAHDVIGHHAELDSTPVRIDCGLSDPFLPASRQLEALIGTGDVDLTPGGHDAAFWRSRAPRQLQFLAS